MRNIDLRSDTFTLPTAAMREAMSRAELGDDVYGEDPTVNHLQEMAAQLMGKEATLFVASGTMGNLVALLSHCGRGDEVILGDQSHIMIHEQGGIAVLGSIVPRPVPNMPDGRLLPHQIKSAIRRGDDVHIGTTKLIALENTWNGRVLKPDYLRAVSELARSNNIPLHLDGARIFNAAVALGVPARQLVDPFDTVQFCLSKGLAAPVGSMICGSRKFIAEATRNRKLVGGGMRQVGVLAAAGIVALTEMVDRLADDHANAKCLANMLAESSDIEIDVDSVETNMVIFKPHESLGLTAEQAADRLAAQGVLVMPLD